MKQVEFPVNALFENIKSIMKKKMEKIMLCSKCCHFVKKIIFSVSKISKMSTLSMQSIRC